MDRLMQFVTPVRAGLAALVLLVLFLLLLMGGGGERQQQGDLLTLLRAVEADYEAPGLTVDEAGPALATPEAAFAFVRDRVWLQAYDGRALTPDDVLVLRGANAADQAVLLAALLETQGVSARLMRADWPAAAPHLGTVESDVRASLSALYDFLELDEREARMAVAQAALEGRDDARNALAQAEALVSARLGVAESRAGSVGQADWVWVEYAGPDGPVVADPVFPDLARPVARTPYVDPGLAPVDLALDLVTAAGARERLLDWQGGLADEPILRFFPAAEVQRFFDSAPGTLHIPAWRPVIATGDRPQAGRPFAVAGDLLPMAASAPLDLSGELPPPPALTRADLSALDVSSWPEIGLTLQTDTPDGARWYAPHLDLDVDGAPVTARILAQPRRTPQLVLITDVSPSMIENGHLFSAGFLGRTLVEGLGRMDSFVSVSAAGDARLDGPGGRRYFQRRDAVLAHNSGLIVRDGDNLPAAIEIARREGDRDAVYVVLTDGRLTPEQEAAFAAALETLPGRIFGVVPETETGRLQPMFDQVWALPPDDATAATAASIRRAFGTDLVLRFNAPEPSGEPRQAFRLGFAGSDLEVSGDYAVPEGYAATQARLEIQMSRGGTPLGARRTLVNLSAADVQSQLIGSRALFLAGGQFAPEALRRRYFAEWRMELETRLSRETGEAQTLPAPIGPSFDAMATAGGLIGQVDSLLGVRVRRTAPIVTLRTALVEIHDSERADLVRSLDILHDGEARLPDGRITPRLGLALAAAETRVLGGEGVNERLLGAPGPLVRIDPETAIPDAWPASVARTLAAQGGTLLALEDGSAGWLMSPGGALEARLFGPDGKGARARQAISDFKDIRNTLTVLGITASGIGSPYGVSGAQLGGIVGILDTNLRLFCYSTVMLGFVTDAMETGELAEDAQQQAAEGCEINPDDLYTTYLAAFGKGYVTGAMGDRATDAVKGIAGGSLPAVTETLVNIEAGILIEISGVGGPIEEALRDAIRD